MSGSFDPSASYVPAGLRKAAKEATNLGWTAKKSGREGWFLRSPKGSEKFYIPATCKDPDTLSRKLRSKMNNAYVNERSAFKPDLPPEAAEAMLALAESAMAKGAVIVPGPDPHITCPMCDDEYDGWEAFANHQEACAKAAAEAKQAKERARVVDLRAAGKTYSEIAEMVSLPRHEVASIVAALLGDLPAKQPKAVPKEGDGAARPSEGVPQDATDSTESVHSGTISTKEETPLATTSTTPTPKPGPKQATKVTANPETGRRQGYKWTQVKGRENPLHEILYEAVRMNRRFTGETDSKWTKRLADYIEGEGLLGKLPDADPDVQAAYVLGQIKELLGVGEPQESEEDAETIKKLEASVAEKDAEIVTLNKKVGDLRGVLSTLSDLAKETDK